MSRPGFPVPEDIVESGSGFKGWVNCTFYGDSIEEVAEKKSQYFKEYPPQGYDTQTLTNVAQHPDGYYYIKIKRWSTCS